MIRSTQVRTEGSNASRLRTRQDQGFTIIEAILPAAPAQEIGAQITAYRNPYFQTLMGALGGLPDCQSL